MPYVFKNVAIGPYCRQGQKVKVIVKMGGGQEHERWELGFLQLTPALLGPGDNPGGSIQFKALEVKGMKTMSLNYDRPPFNTETYYIVEHPEVFAVIGVPLSLARQWAIKYNNKDLEDHLLREARR